jgi:hypothetical protein
MDLGYLIPLKGINGIRETDTFERMNGIRLAETYERNEWTKVS